MSGQKLPPPMPPQASPKKAGERSHRAFDDLRRLIDLQDLVRESYREIGEIKKRARAAETVAGETK